MNTHHQNFEQLVRALYTNGQLIVSADDMEVRIDCANYVLDMCFSWLVQRASFDFESRSDFLYQDFMGEGCNKSLIDALFYTVSEGCDLTEAKRDYAREFIVSEYGEYLAKLSGVSDCLKTQSDRELRDMHNAADDAGVLMHGRAA